MFSLPDIIIGGLAALGIVFLVDKMKSVEGRQKSKHCTSGTTSASCGRSGAASGNSMQDFGASPGTVQKRTEEEMAEAGKAGERMVKEALAPFEDKYDVFHDLRIASPRKRRQIDHLVVSENAVFIIETKAYTIKQQINQKNNGDWKRKYDDDPIRNPYMQLKEVVLCLNQIFHNESIKNVTIQPVAVFAFGINAGNIESNIPHMQPYKIPHYVNNYYAQYKINSVTRERLLQVFSMIQAGEAYSWKLESREP